MLKPAFWSRPVEPLASVKRDGERATDTLGSSRATSRMSRIWPSSSAWALITSMLMGNSSRSCSLREPLMTTSLSTGPAATSWATSCACPCACALPMATHAQATSHVSGRKRPCSHGSEACACARREENGGERNACATEGSPSLKRQRIQSWLHADGPGFCAQKIGRLWLADGVYYMRIILNTYQKYPKDSDRNQNDRCDLQTAGGLCTAGTPKSAIDQRLFLDEHLQSQKTVDPGSSRRSAREG